MKWLSPEWLNEQPIRWLRGARNSSAFNKDWVWCTSSIMWIVGTLFSFRQVMRIYWPSTFLCWKTEKGWRGDFPHYEHNCFTVRVLWWLHCLVWFLVTLITRPHITWHLPVRISQRLIWIIHETWMRWNMLLNRLLAQDFATLQETA
jgi:hypothetical protein